MRIHSLPPAAPEPGLSRAAICCLAGDFLLIFACFVSVWIYWPIWQVADVMGFSPRIDPPVSTMAGWERHPDPCWVLSVTANAQLWHAKKPCELADLGEALREATLALDRQCRMEGSSAYEEFPLGGRASKLMLYLRLDRAAPWGAVHEVLRRAGECGLYRIQFAVRAPDEWHSKILGACLPWPGEEHDAEIGVHVRRGADGAFVYSHAGFEACDPAALQPRFRAAYEEHRNDRVVGTIHAPRDAPFQAVVGALDALAGAGLWRVDFFVDDIRAEVIPR